MSNGSLFIIDSRTSKEYVVPITRNSVNASDFQKIVGPEVGTNPADKVARGLRLFDPGLHHTATHESKITWVDGQNGLLLFRGHSFEQLWNNDFEDMIHLMVWETMPTPEEKEELRRDIADVACSLPDSVAQTVRSFPSNGPAVPMILAGLAAYTAAVPSILPAFNAGNTFHKSPEMVRMGITHTIAVYLTVIGMAFCHRKGIKFTPPQKDATCYENLLIMTGKVDAAGRPDELLHDSLRHAGAMGADHEITNSTFALLVGASSLADPISCLISAVASGYGPLHMGACESAYKTMQNLGGVENVPHLIDAVKSGKRRLYGYGHRMYKTIDPRIKYIKGLLKALNAEADPVLATAMEIDRIASTDEYFVKRDLHANVDLYIVFFGIAMGFPSDFIPIMIVFLRLPGYMAHYREAMDRDIKLMRPAGFHTGPTTPINVPTPGTEQTPATEFEDVQTDTKLDLHDSAHGSPKLLPINPVLEEVQTDDVKTAHIEQATGLLIDTV